MYELKFMCRENTNRYTRFILQTLTDVLGEAALNNEKTYW